MPTHRHRPRETTPARSRGPKTPDHHHRSQPLPRASLPAPARAAPARTFEISYSKRNTPSGDADSTSPAPAGVLRTATRRRGAASTARHRRAAAGATVAWRGPRTAREAVAVIVIVVVVVVVVNIVVVVCARARVASAPSMRCVSDIMRENAHSCASRGSTATRTRGASRTRVHRVRSPRATSRADRASRDGGASVRAPVDTIA